MCNMYIQLYMCLYLRTKLEVSSIILVSFRQGRIFYQGPSTTTAKQTPKKPTQIRVKNFNFKVTDE